MTDERLAEIEKYFEVKYGTRTETYEFVIDLITALRAEKAKVAELQDIIKDTIGFTEELVVEVNRNSYSGYISGKCNWCKSQWEGFDNPKEKHGSNCVYNNLKIHIFNTIT